MERSRTVPPPPLPPVGEQADPRINHWRRDCGNGIERMAYGEVAIALFHLRSANITSIGTCSNTETWPIVAGGDALYDILPRGTRRKSA